MAPSGSATTPAVGSDGAPAVPADVDPVELDKRARTEGPAVTPNTQSDESLSRDVAADPLSAALSKDPRGLPILQDMLVLLDLGSWWLWSDLQHLLTGLWWLCGAFANSCWLRAMVAASLVAAGAVVLACAEW